jgi:hypothetical protein
MTVSRWDAGDWTEAISNLNGLAASCYSCHVASGKPYLRLKIPMQPEAQIIQFEPGP